MGKVRWGRGERNREKGRTESTGEIERDEGMRRGRRG